MAPISVPEAPLSATVLPGVIECDSPEEFQQKIGTTCPAFDQTRPIQLWFDQKAMESALPRRVYARTAMLNDKGSQVWDQGIPQFEPMVVPKEHASSPNIPSEADLMNIKAGVFPKLGRLSLPLRDLFPGEIYAKSLTIGEPVCVVRNVALYEETLQQDPIVRIEALCKAILQEVRK